MAIVGSAEADSEHILGKSIATYARKLLGVDKLASTDDFKVTFPTYCLKIYLNLYLSVTLKVPKTESLFVVDWLRGFYFEVFPCLCRGVNIVVCLDVSTDIKKIVFDF